MGTSDRHPRNRLLLCATAGLGFCFASTECERYTALWEFGTRTPEELVLVMVSLCALLGLAAFHAVSTKRQICSKTTVVGALAAIQTFGIAVRILHAYGFAMPSSLLSFGSLCLQSSGLLFVLYAEFFLGVGIRKSVRSFASALVIAGSLQIACAELPAGLSLVLVLLFMPASSLLLLAAVRTKQASGPLSEDEDVAAEREHSESFAHASPFWECCASIILINVLLLALHNQAMAFQDNGQTSQVIQVSSGLGSISAGAIFLALLNYVQEFEFIELFRVIVLPLTLVTLYVSALFGGSTPAVFLIPLGICYSVLLLLVWAVPRCCASSGQAFVFTCMAFASYKLGWAFGIGGIMIAPRMLGEDAASVVIMASFVVLLLLAAVHVIRSWRMGARRTQAIPPSSMTLEELDSSFDAACKRVSGRFGLTPRETEVLALLAKGRNARHISEALTISDGTARTHIMHIYQKMGVNSQQALIDCVEGELVQRRMQSRFT